MYAYLISELSKYGSFEETETRKIYVPNNPNRTILVVLDHILLLRKNKGRTKKEEIDLASNYLITLRNRCGISPVVVMQTNRGATSMDRRKEGLSEFKLEDWRSKNFFEDLLFIIEIILYFCINNKQIIKSKFYGKRRIKTTIFKTVRTR